MTSLIREERSIGQAELRVARGGDGTHIVGYAAVFNEWTDLGEIREVIRPGAFSRAIEEKQDVRALVNHDPTLVLGRTKNGTLSLVEDKRGLKVDIEPPDTQLGKDTLSLLEKGYLDGMSFAFSLRNRRGDRWKGNERELLDLDLYDVSVVTYPAYEATNAAVRTLEGAMVSLKKALEEERREERLRLFEARSLLPRGGKSI